jgi:ankyrin repeat protein
MIAARAGKASTVNALLNHLPRDVVRVNAVDDKRRTALHHCCAAGLDDKDDDFGTVASNPTSLRCCRALVRAGVDVNAADKFGRTALMLACQSYVPGANVSVIRYLVEHGGADPVRQDSDGRDSFDYCPPIDSDYVRAVLREGAGNIRHNSLRCKAPCKNSKYI